MLHHDIQKDVLVIWTEIALLNCSPVFMDQSESEEIALLRLAVRPEQSASSILVVEVKRKLR